MNVFKQEFLRQSNQFLGNPAWRLGRLGLNEPQVAAPSPPQPPVMRQSATPAYNPVAEAANIGNINLPAFQPMQRQQLRKPAPTMQDRIGSFY